MQFAPHALAQDERSTTSSFGVWSRLSISNYAFGFRSFTATQCLFSASQTLSVLQTGCLGEQDFPAKVDFKLRVHRHLPFSQPQFSGQLTQRFVFGSTNRPVPQEQVERLASHDAPAAHATQVFLLESQFFPSGQVPLALTALPGACAEGSFCGSIACWPGHVSF